MISTISRIRHGPLVEESVYVQILLFLSMLFLLWRTLISCVAREEQKIAYFNILYFFCGWYHRN